MKLCLLHAISIPSIFATDWQDSLLCDSMPRQQCKDLCHEQSETSYWQKRHTKQLVNKRKNYIKHIRSYTDSEIVKMKAKNIVLFVGDGMNIDSVSAGRIHMGIKKAEAKGNRQPGCGEEFVSNIDKFPFTGLSKTYSVNKQTPDSASTSTALHTGVKGSFMTVGMNGGQSFGLVNTLFSFYGKDTRNCLNHRSISKMLKDKRGKTNFKVGLVTTTHHAHATPAGSYACHNSRFNYGAITKDFVAAIRENELDLSFGGGYSYMNKYAQEAVVRNKTGVKFVTTRTQMKKIKIKDLKDQNKATVGCFAKKHMPYQDEIMAKNESTREPTLPEMALKAVNILKNTAKDGFYLMIEGGKIDKAHHENMGRRATEEFRQFDKAIGNVVRYLNRTKELKNTLIIVTADHGHSYTFGSYQPRGKEVHEQAPSFKIPKLETNKDGRLVKYDNDPSGDTVDIGLVNHTAAGYYTGPGAQYADPKSPCKSPTSGGGIISMIGNIGKSFEGVNEDQSNPNARKLNSAVHMSNAAHSGEDVPIYASGPFSHLLSGVHEQTFINYIMKYAACVGPGIEKLVTPHCD